MSMLCKGATYGFHFEIITLFNIFSIADFVVLYQRVNIMEEQETSLWGIFYYF